MKFICTQDNCTDPQSKQNVTKNILNRNLNIDLTEDVKTVEKVRGLSQIIFPTVSVIITLRGGGGGGVGSLRA